MYLFRTEPEESLYKPVAIKETKSFLKFQIDSGFTCSILPVNIYKDTIGGNDLKDLNTAFKPFLSLYDEETKIQTLGTRKSLYLNLLPVKK